MPPMSSNKFERYCDGMVKALQDEKSCIASFQNAVELLDSALEGQYDRDKAKDASLLSAVEGLCGAVKLLSGASLTSG